MATIIIPTPLRKFTNGEGKFETSADSVKGGIRALAEAHPDLEKHLFDEGKLRAFIRVFVGDEDIEALDQEETAVQQQDIISIIPAIAGGKV